jgi:uncharacterized protein YkwD
VSAAKQRAAEVATAIESFVDQRRTERGRPSLANDPDLAAIATEHSRGAARRGELSATNARGETVGDRVTGYRYVTQTLYSATGRDRPPRNIAREVVGGWMDDQQVRRRLLNPGLDHNGVGVWIEDDTVYVTQLLCSEAPIYRRFGAWLLVGGRRLTAPVESLTNRL